MSGQVSSGSAGEYQADEQEGVAQLTWRVSGRFSFYSKLIFWKSWFCGFLEGRVPVLFILVFSCSFNDDFVELLTLAGNVLGNWDIEVETKDVVHLQ